MDTPNTPFLDCPFSILLVGDARVGKSSLYSRTIYDTYQDSYIPTIGSDFRSKISNVKNNRFKMQLWDVSGNIKYRDFISAFCNRVDCIAILFDLTDICSFNNVTDWINDITANTNRKKLLFLIGTKADMLGQNPDNDVKHDDIMDFATRNNMVYMETSSKANKGVDEAFREMCIKFLDSKILSH